MSKQIAEVGFSCGRSYLKVAGVIVAVEGDRCRDCGNIPEEFKDPIPDHVYEGTIGGKPITRDMDPDLIRFFVGENWSEKMLCYLANRINEN